MAAGPARRRRLSPLLKELRLWDRRARRGVLPPDDLVSGWEARIARESTPAEASELAERVESIRRAMGMASGAEKLVADAASRSPDPDAPGLTPWQGLDHLVGQRRLAPFAGLGSLAAPIGMPSGREADFGRALASRQSDFLSTLAGLASSMPPADGYAFPEMPLAFETEIEVDWVDTESSPWQQPDALARARATAESLARQGVRVKLVRGRPVPSVHYQPAMATPSAAFSLPGPRGPVSLDRLELVDRAMLVAQRPNRLQVVVPPSRYRPPALVQPVRPASEPTSAAAAGSAARGEDEGRPQPFGTRRPIVVPAPLLTPSSRPRLVTTPRPRVTDRFATRIASAFTIGPAPAGSAPGSPSALVPSARLIGTPLSTESTEGHPATLTPPRPSLPPLPPPALMRSADPSAEPAARPGRVSFASSPTFVGRGPALAPTVTRGSIWRRFGVGRRAIDRGLVGGVTGGAPLDGPEPTSIRIALNWVAGADPWQRPEVIERARDSLRALEFQGIRVEIVRGHAVAAHRYQPDLDQPTGPLSLLGPAGTVSLDTLDIFDRAVVIGQSTSALQVVVSPRVLAPGRAALPATLAPSDVLPYGPSLALPLAIVDERYETTDDAGAPTPPVPEVRRPARSRQPGIGTLPPTPTITAASPIVGRHAPPELAPSPTRLAFPRPSVWQHPIRGQGSAESRTSEVARSTIPTGLRAGATPLETVRIALDWVAGDEVWTREDLAAQFRPIAQELAERGVRLELVRGRRVPPSRYDSRQGRSRAAFNVLSVAGPLSLSDVDVVEQANLIAARPGFLRLLVAPTSVRRAARATRVPDVSSREPRPATGQFRPGPSFDADTPTSTVETMESGDRPSLTRGQWLPRAPEEPITSRIALDLGNRPGPSLATAPWSETLASDVGPQSRFSAPLPLPLVPVAVDKDAAVVSPTVEPSTIPIQHRERVAGGPGPRTVSRTAPTSRATARQAPGITPSSILQGIATAAPAFSPASPTNEAPVTVRIALDWVAGADPWQRPAVMERAREAARRLESRGVQVEIVRGHAVPAHRYDASRARAGGSFVVSSPTGPVALGVLEVLDRANLVADRPGALRALVAPVETAAAAAPVMGSAIGRAPTESAIGSRRIEHPSIGALPSVAPSERAHRAAASSEGASAIGPASIGPMLIGRRSEGVPSVEVPSIGLSSVGAPSVGAPSIGAPSVGASSVGAPSIGASSIGTSPIGALSIAVPFLGASAIEAPTTGAISPIAPEIGPALTFAIPEPVTDDRPEPGASALPAEPARAAPRRFRSRPEPVRIVVDWVVGQDPWRSGRRPSVQPEVERYLARQGVRLEFVRGREVTATAYEETRARAGGTLTVTGARGTISLEGVDALANAVPVARRPGHLQVILGTSSRETATTRSMPMPLATAGSATPAFATASAAVDESGLPGVSVGRRSSPATPSSRPSSPAGPTGTVRSASSTRAVFEPGTAWLSPRQSLHSTIASSVNLFTSRFVSPPTPMRAGASVAAARPIVGVAAGGAPLRSSSPIASATGPMMVQRVIQRSSTGATGRDDQSATDEERLALAFGGPSRSIESELPIVGQGRPGDAASTGASRSIAHQGLVGWALNGPEPFEPASRRDSGAGLTPLNVLVVDVPRADAGPAPDLALAAPMPASPTVGSAVTRIERGSPAPSAAASTMPPLVFAREHAPDILPLRRQDVARQEEGASAVSNRPTGPATTTTAAGSGSAGPEGPKPPDLDQLARQVYAMLKQRLAVERERLGRPRGLRTW